jgi:hypothetical protein
VAGIVSTLKQRDRSSDYEFASGSGRGGGAHTKSELAAAAVSGDLKRAEMQRLLDETRSTYRRGG